MADTVDTLEKVWTDYEADPFLSVLRRNATQLVKGVGPPDPLVIFVGEAPGATEDKMGIPFVGRAGKFFDELLASIDLSRDDVYVTNTVKYRPRNDGRNRPPTFGEVAKSKEYLDRELALLDCNVIVPLGRHACSVFIPDPKLNQIHGRIIEQGSEFIIPQYHPAIGGIYRRGEYGPIMMDDFKKISIVLDALEARENNET
jgi:DNA polymerase